jgi:hypothetical protein
MAFDIGAKLLADLPADFKLHLFDSREVQPLVEAALTEAEAWHKRKRLLPAPLMVWFTTMLVLFRDLSIPDVFKVLVSALRRARPGLRLRQVTPEALCHARARLGWKPLQALFQRIAEAFAPPPTFRELFVWGVDGATFKVPDTEANEAFFGRPAASRGQTAFPQVGGAFLVATETHHISAASFGPCGEPERPQAEALLEHLGPEDLVLMDRGFAAGWLFECFLARKVHFLCRIPANWQCMVVRVLGPGDYLVKVNTQAPSPEARALGRKSKRGTLLLRMIQYQVGKSPCSRVLTDLLDSEGYPARELAALYHERWECELVYDECKNHLATVTHGALHTPFRSKSPDGVLQEAYGLLVAYNLVRSLMTEAGRLHDIRPREISFVQTLRVIRLALPRFQGASPAQLRHLTRQLYQDIADCRLDRPRRPRSYPRKVKVKMSNFQVKGPGDKEVRLDPRTDLQLVGT